MVDSTEPFRRVAVSAVNSQVQSDDENVLPVILRVKFLEDVLASAGPEREKGLLKLVYQKDEVSFVPASALQRLEMYGVRFEVLGVLEGNELREYMKACEEQVQT